MDTLFHFIFPLIAILAARIKVKHKISIIFGLALVTALLDIDHFFGVPRGTLHNIFITLILPMFFLLLSFKFEKGDYYKNISLILLLFLFSHTILDMFTEGGVKLDMFTEGGVKLFYPFSDQSYDLTKFLISIQLPSGIEVHLISTSGIGLTIYFVMILSVIFVEDFIRYLKREKRVEKAFLETIQAEEKKIEKGI